MQGFGAVCAFCLTILSVLPAMAQGPEQTVQWIYTSLVNPGPAETKGLAYLTAPAQRPQFLSRRLSAFFDANDTYGDDPGAACVDFAFDIPGNDFDETEVARTLQVTTSGDDTARSITARFTNFGQPATIIYDFIAEDGFWRLDDIAGPGWRVSQIPCTAKTAGQAGSAPAQSAAYCYSNGNDTLRLDLGQGGQAGILLSSWQANGHSCTVEGQARPITGGWVFRNPQAGPTCRLEILVTPEQGLRLSDPDWGCKTYHCGQRAVLDGLTFPRASQIDCAAMPAN